jgi:hypothetical protein
MDFEETIAALQAYIGERVVVAVVMPSQQSFVLALMAGPLSKAVETPNWSRHYEGSLAFFVNRSGESELGGNFGIAPALFEHGEWRHEPYPETLYVYQAGTAITINRTADMAGGNK